MRKAAAYILTVIICLVALPVTVSAQFKPDAFSQDYGSDGSDTTSKAMFSVKDYCRQLTHKDSVAHIGTLFAGSAVLIGGQQIYQKQYWKLPLIYGSIGAGTGLGFYYRNKYKTSLNAYNEAFELDPETTLTVDRKSKNMSTIMFAAAGVAYWGTMMDGVVCFDRGTYPQAGKATLYSLLLPGLGQAYNQEYWKIPIYWGALLGAYHFWDHNRTNFKRFRSIYLEAVDTEVKYTGPISSSTASYYRDYYRRMRDYSVLALAAFYLIQVIDANIFAYMQDFEVNDDLSMHVSPTVINTDMQFASSYGLGMSVGFRF